MIDSLTRFSNNGVNQGRISLLNAIHTEALDGTDQIVGLTYDVVNKGDRVVWRDNHDIWHEQIVDQGTVAQDDEHGIPAGNFTAINSIAELYGTQVGIVAYETIDPTTILTELLADTRWSVGVVEFNDSKPVYLQYISVREAVDRVFDAWGAELETVIACNDEGVVKRVVNMRIARGDSNSPKRFEYGKDLVNTRVITGATDPVTRVYCYGAYNPGQDEDGNDNPITDTTPRYDITSVNNDLPYVDADASVLANWGIDGAPYSITIIYDDVTDPSELLAYATAQLAERSIPRISYECDVVDLEYMPGWDHETCDLGDTVSVINTTFTEPLRVQQRVVKIERNLLTNNSTITVGDYVRSITAMTKMALSVSDSSDDDSDRTTKSSASQKYVKKELDRTASSLKKYTRDYVANHAGVPSTLEDSYKNAWYLKGTNPNRLKSKGWDPETMEVTEKTATLTHYQAFLASCQLRRCYETQPFVVQPMVNGIGGFVFTDDNGIIRTNVGCATSWVASSGSYSGLYLKKGTKQGSENGIALRLNFDQIVLESSNIVFTSNPTVSPSV